MQNLLQFFFFFVNKKISVQTCDLLCFRNGIFAGTKSLIRQSKKKNRQSYWNTRRPNRFQKCSVKKKCSEFPNPGSTRNSSSYAVALLLLLLLKKKDTATFIKAESITDNIVSNKHNTVTFTSQTLTRFIKRWAIYNTPFVQICCVLVPTTETPSRMTTDAV